MISVIQNRGRNYKISVPDALEFYCIEPVTDTVDRIFFFFRRRGETPEKVLTRARGMHPTAEVLRPYIGERNDAAPGFGIDPAHSGEVHFDVQWEDNKKSTILDSRKFYALVNFTLRPEDRDKLILDESPGPAAPPPAPGPALAAAAARVTPRPGSSPSVQVVKGGPSASGRPMPSGTTFLSADIGRLAAMWAELPAEVRAAILTMAEAARNKGGTTGGARG